MYKKQVILYKIMQERRAWQRPVAQPLNKGMVGIGAPLIRAPVAPLCKGGPVSCAGHGAVTSMAMASTAKGASIRPASCRNVSNRA